MSGNDPSHDIQHVLRVRDLAVKIAMEESEKQEVDMLVVEAGALLHDIYDHKYSTADPGSIRDLLVGHDALIVDKIIQVVKKVGYTQHCKDIMNREEVSIETRCIRDADYLDAVGAFGILRTAAYASYKGHSLHLPRDDPEYASCCLQHFYDKLLKLKDMITTDTGAELMRPRHDFMVQFLDHLRLEEIANRPSQSRNA